MSQFTCEICRKSYRAYPSLWRHKKHECSQPKNFCCTYCGRTFRQKYDVKLHVRNLHPEKAEEFELRYKEWYKSNKKFFLKGNT
nr:unnamed protein product [Callosobruchus chinensis]